MGAATHEYVSLATLKIAFFSASNASGKMENPSRHPPAPWHLEIAEKMIVLSLAYLLILG